MSEPGLHDMFDFSGRIAIVTGASSGLGQSVARMLSAGGATTVLVARRKERLESLADELAGAVPMACDLADPEDREALVRSTADDLGRIDVLVNAAGTIAGPIPAETESLDSIRLTLEVNLVAPFHLAQLSQPVMSPAGGGAIVNIGSISGVCGIPGIPQASYAAAKHGLSGLTRELAVQWGRTAVRVNTVAAGFFKSEMTDELYGDPKSLAWLRRNTLLPIEATADDIAGAAVWLASDAARYVTGQTIVVDGGWTAK